MRVSPICEAAQSCREASAVTKKSAVSTYGDGQYAIPSAQNIAELAYILKFQDLSKKTKYSVISFLYKKTDPIGKNFSDWNMSKTEIEELSGNWDLNIRLEAIMDGQVYRIRCGFIGCSGVKGCRSV